ncbi:MAG: GxxExxY protein [Methylacidiphilales bacterium]|nr:GxxExxY protein [Candidatus Methylacidiphilales bacterium]
MLPTLAKSSTQVDPLTQKVIGEAMYVHRTLGSGFLESIYHHALLIRLRKLGLKVESQKPLSVYFEGEIIGDFATDLIVEERLILKLKAVSALNSAHEVQLVNYLTATKIETGLLLNFGTKSLEFKRKSRTLDLPRDREISELIGSQSC